uniref:N-acetyltransferase domain-containing protein n=1 Tax=Rhodosorus marinus TaxID=101924 RepID=A0A7S2ZEC5_9RHOD|mmetsp:Transcript_15353/g.62649  ORF Transcript_15353/g.62649 Transcript_15353/m.62649 type:complete len:197 (+) Transcript_15353:60-650(+)
MSAPAFVSVPSVVAKRSTSGPCNVGGNRRSHAKGGARVLTELCAELRSRIRSATEDDIDLLVDIYSDAFLGDAESVGLLKKPWFAWRKVEVRKQMSEMFDFINRDKVERLHMVYIAELDSTGQAAGFVQLMTMPCPFPPDRRPAPDLPYIGNLSVFHKYRRRGVASALVTHCEDVARSKGFSEIFLHVELGNLPAR